MAEASMFLGISSIVFAFPFFSLLLSLLAITFGHIAFRQISRQPQTSAGKRKAIVGLATGYVGMVIGVFATVALGPFLLMYFQWNGR